MPQPQKSVSTQLFSAFFVVVVVVLVVSCSMLLPLLGLRWLSWCLGRVSLVEYMMRRIQVCLFHLLSYLLLCGRPDDHCDHDYDDLGIHQYHDHHRDDCHHRSLRRHRSSIATSSDYASYLHSTPQDGVGRTTIRMRRGWTEGRWRRRTMMTR